MLIFEQAISVKNVNEYLWDGYFVCFALQNLVSDHPKHYVWASQTVCLTISNILFDNFNTCFSCTQLFCFVLTTWLSSDCRCMRNTRIFCPSDFGNDFRGHSRDTKRAKIDYSFSVVWYCFSLQHAADDRKNLINAALKSLLQAIIVNTKYILYKIFWFVNKIVYFCREY